MSSNNNLTVQQSRRIKGQALARIDREQKMLHSGTQGPKRLVMNIALDFQEKYPSMTDEQAMTAALGYCERTYGQA